MEVSWRPHLVAVGILALVGAGSIVGVHESMAGTLGTRAFGYGALALLSLALIIGPVARLWPRELSKLLVYRRAVGIWSAVAAGVHLLFALQLASAYGKELPRPFLRESIGFHPDMTPIRRLVLDLDNLGALAWIGLIALVLLMVVAAVSNDRAQRFLGNASWKLVQQTTYGAFLFVALHILIMRYGGKMKLSPPLLWWAPWALLAVVGLQIAGFVTTARKPRSRK